MNIEKVAVIGAGVMGASIAAHISNAGVPVYLLDIVPKDAKNRNIIAETALKKLLKGEPAPLMRKKNARLIKPGNIEDHLSWLGDANWVIEAVIENLDIKQHLYKQLHEICPETTLLSSNTSTLPLHFLTNGLPDAFKSRFMITHFFNPPRYMRLLELIAAPQTRPELISDINQFADIRLGKGCVTCKDTPGFIANRIGIYWMQCGMVEAMRLDLSVEQADAVMGAPLGIPKTGIFGLLDLIGLDLMPHIMKSMRQALAPDDALQKIIETPEFLQKMIADGYTGRKGKGGFYRLQKSAGKRIKESIDLHSGAYHLSEKPRLESIKTSKQEGIRSLLSYPDNTGDFAWQVLSNTLVYCANLVPEISDDIVSIDTAMRLGFNWKQGPFELLDNIGVEWFNEKLRQQGRAVPALLTTGKPMYKTDSNAAYALDLSGAYQTLPKQDGKLNLAQIKNQTSAVLSNASASLWDIGDGVACLEFHSKMNTLDMEIMQLIAQSIAKVKTDFSALVIYNDAENFSAGANLGLLMIAITEGNWSAVEELLQDGQQTYKALKYAPFPVVGAPSGLALGGGCEILLHCDAIQAHAELYIGLVEVGVGLIPGWGGCKEYIRRCQQQPRRAGGPIPPIVKAFQTIGMASVAKSAFEAQEMLYLSRDNAITMNRDRLLADAKSKALSLTENYNAPDPYEYQLPGKTAYYLMLTAIKALRMTGQATSYDVEVGKRLAFVLSGGDSDITESLSEDAVLTLEREAFLHLVKQPGTLARLEHMLKTGKPLRN